jgi:formate dehydrogenase subunit gamma
MQGAIDGMTSGYCDLNWARDHHSWWAQKAIEQGKAIPKDGRHRDKSVNAAPAAAAREAES